MRNPAQQLDADWERARGQMYGFFAAVLLNRPDREMLEGLLSQKAVDSLQSVFPDHPASARLARLAEGYRQGRHSDEDFLLDYEALFRVPGDTYTHPFESAYLAAGDGDHAESKHSLDPGRRRLVAATYQRQGLAPGGNFDEPLDHIGVQLDFMSCLCRLAAEALGRGDVDEALRLVAEQEAFLGEHLLAWGAECLAKVEAHAASELYGCLAGLGRTFLALEREERPL
jgi:TorA maturation chaperone TorD